MAGKHRTNKKKELSCRKNKNGIPLLNPGQSLFPMFCDACEDTGKQRIENTGNHLLEDTGAHQPANTGAPPHENNSLENNQKSCSETLNQKADVRQGSAGEKKRVTQSRIKRNKHGIPFLDGEESLSGMFQKHNEFDNHSMDHSVLSDLIDATLKGQNSDALMRAKKGSPPPEPVPLKKRLKRYPLPERKLDLHGFTAAEAVVKTEAFLRTALMNGIFTLKIIVGRGLHSPHGAVLPDVVEDYLRKLKKQGIVLWFEWDKKHKVKSGAVIVYLNQFND